MGSAERLDHFVGRPKRTRDIEKEIRRIADEIAKAEPGKSKSMKDRPITIDGRIVEIVQPRESGPSDVIRLESARWQTAGWDSEVTGGELALNAIRFVVEEWELTRRRSDEANARWEAGEEEYEKKGEGRDRYGAEQMGIRWSNFFSHLESEAEARVFEAIQIADRADEDVINRRNSVTLRPAIFDLEGTFYLALPQSEHVDAPHVLVTSDFHADQMIISD